MIPTPLFYLVVTIGVFICVLNWRRYEAGTSIFLATFFVLMGLSRTLKTEGQPEMLRLMLEVAVIGLGIITAAHWLWLAFTAKKPRQQ
jgi:hypothetical protein